MTMQAHERINAGLGALALIMQRKRDGVGALGPLGNASTIDAGNYQVTGSQVALRNPLSPGLPDDNSVIARLNIGDTVTTDGTVSGTNGPNNGPFTNFAFVTTATNQQGWVAIEYLAPAGTVQPSSGGGGGGNTVPVSLDTSQNNTGGQSTSYLPYILGGVAAAGLLTIGVVALTGKKGKGKKHRR